MAGIFDFIFSGTTDAHRADLRQQGELATRGAARASNSAANRGGANPAAVATGTAQAQTEQRAANATAAANQLQQSRMADRQQGNQILGALLGTAGTIGTGFLPGGQFAEDLYGGAAEAAAPGVQTPAAPVVGGAQSYMGTPLPGAPQQAPRVPNTTPPAAGQPPQMMNPYQAGATGTENVASNDLLRYLLQFGGNQ